MVASSTSTYLDVTQAAKGGPEPAQETADPEFTARTAKVLAAIHTGTEAVTELPIKSGLPPDQVLASLAWLSQAGMVELDDQDGGLSARLTEPARAALISK